MSHDIKLFLKTEETCHRLQQGTFSAMVQFTENKFQIFVHNKKQSAKTYLFPSVSVCQQTHLSCI